VVAAAARLSVELNHALADGACGRTPSWCRLARRMLALGLSGCPRFLRDSRLVERLQARIRAKMVSRPVLVS
jgi:EAL domain-containing protein (putative c-di-GMP-specific phosphodiesterase class I)